MPASGKETPIPQTAGHGGYIADGRRGVAGGKLFSIQKEFFHKDLGAAHGLEEDVITLFHLKFSFITVDCPFMKGLDKGKLDFFTEIPVIVIICTHKNTPLILDYMISSSTPSGIL